MTTEVVDAEVLSVTDLEPYKEPGPECPAAIIVDLDGTLALNDGRPIFDWDRVIEDRPNYPVIYMVRNMQRAGYRVLLLTGRKEQCRADTERWLKMHLGVPYDMLLMRQDDDGRVDTEFKPSAFYLNVRNKYRVLFVVDDRSSTTRTWRNMGFTVLQCAEGNY